MKAILPTAHSPVGACSHADEPAWRTALREAVRDPDDLCRLLELPQEFADMARAACASFPLFVPRSFILRMNRADPVDPLLLQVLPRAEEMSVLPGYRRDPVGDTSAQRTPGLLHKYQHRMLLVTTGACAAHCRYCFRRHYPYGAGSMGGTNWDSAAATIAADDSIQEVILSGGDPLTLTDDRLSRLVAQLQRSEHLRWLRVHTRLPVLIPERVDDHLLAWIGDTRLSTTIVIHANHAQELNDEVAAAVGRLSCAGCIMLNQAVWLRGINDTLVDQRELCQRLIDIGVIPYYLHQLDRVAGAAHFEAEEKRGRHVIAQLRRELPGYAVPRFVREEEGAEHKTVLA